MIETVAEDTNSKEDENLFNIEDFLQGLSGQEPFKHLKTFIELADDASKIDVVKQYVEHSSKGSHCTEMVSLMTRKITVSQLTTIFKAMQEVFVRIASDLNSYSSWVPTWIRRFTEPEKILNINRGLSVGNTSTEIITTLRFLTSIVMTSCEAAKELYSKMKWRRDLMELLSRTDTKIEKDVRFCFIEFLLSFFVVGNSALKQKMLDANEFLIAVFTKLQVDKCSTIQMFLSGITSYIIEDTGILKTNKIRLLYLKTLIYIVQLFHWKGMKKFEKKIEKLTLAEREAGGEVVGKASQEEIVVVQRLAQEFLVAVCCSTKKGIAFTDPLMGTGRDMNSNIRAILASEKPFTNPLMETTYLEILKACPDQIIHFFEHIKAIFEPRVSDMWFSAMAFTMKVFEEVDLMKVIRTVNFNVSINKLLDIFVNVCCAKSLFSSRLVEILENVSPSVKQHGIKYIQIVLKQMNKLVDEAEAEARCLKSRIPMFDQFKEKFTQRIFNMLPPMEGFLMLWETTVREAPEKAYVVDDRELSLYDQLCGLLDIFNIYTAKKLGDAEAHSLSMVKLLNLSSTLAEKLPHEEHIDILMKILRCLADNVTDSNFLLEQVRNKSVINILLSTVRSTKDPDSHKLILNILKELLIYSSAFSSCESELDIWLQNLLFFKKKAVDVDLFFEKMCELIITSPEDYVAAVKHFMLSGGQKESEKDDKFKELFDALLNDYNLNEFEDENTAYSARFNSFSPFIAVAFDLMSKKDYSTACHNYFSTVVEELLVSRTDIYPLFYYVKQSAACFLEPFQKYLDMLQDKISNVTNEIDINVEQDLKSLIRGGFYLGKLPAKCTKNLQEMVNDCDKIELLMCTFETLTYISIMQQQEKKDKIIDTFCQILELIVSHRIEEEKYNFMLSFYLQDLVSVILQHPAVQNRFLSSKQWRTTQLVLNILKGRTDLEVPAKHFYLKKVSDFLLQRVSTKDWSVDLNEIADTFQVELGWKAVGQLLAHLSELSHTYWISNNKLNDVGHFIVKLIGRATYLHSKAVEISRVHHAIVSAEVIQKFFQHYIQLNGARAAKEFGKALLKFISSNTLNVFSVNREIVGRLLRQSNNSTSKKMVGLFCHYSQCHLEEFEDYFLELDEFDECEEILIKYFENSSYSICNSEKSELSFKKMAEYFWPRLVLSFQEEERALSGELIHSFVKWVSINPFIDLDDLQHYCQQYSSTLFKSMLSPVLLKSSRWIYERLFQSGQLINNFNPLSLWIYNWLQYILPRISENYDKDEVKQLSEIIETIDELPDFGKILHQQKMWHKLLKTTLKIGFMNENGIAILNLLSVILKKLKLNGELWSIHCTSIYAMVVSHSNFVPGILDCSSAKIEWKNMVVDLLIFLTETESACCDKAHIPILLSAYGATFRELDQKILYLIFLYEKSGIDIQSYRPFLWGPSAIGHYTMDKTITHSLWKKPSMGEILNLLDDQIVLKTAYDFPINLKLQPYVASVEDNVKNLYDSRFLQLLFSNLLSPESLIDCHKFIYSNGLAFLMASLSSEDVDMRAMSYHNIALFYGHLEGSNYRQKKFWVYILDLLKNSVEEENVQIPSLIAVFLIKCCLIYDNPRDLMYKPIIDFILLKPKLDLKYVPEFIKLFHSGDVQHHEMHRNWMLKYMAVGFRSTIDYVLCHNRHVFKFCMTYFDCPLSSNTARLNILLFLKKATTIPIVANKLVNRHALIPFIASVFKRENEEITSHCVDIISNIWKHISHDEYFLSETLRLLLAAMPQFRAYQSVLTSDNYFKLLASCLDASQTSFNIAQKILTDAHMERLVELILIFNERVANSSLNDDLHRTCIDSICDVILNWKIEVDKQTFAYLLNFLLQNIRPNKNAAKIEPLYRWLDNALKCLPLSSVTRNVLENLFFCYEHFLFETKEAVGQKLSELQAINSTFISITEKLTEIEDDQQLHPLLKHLSTDEVQQKLNSVALKKIITNCGNASESLILSVCACELWTFSSQIERCEHFSKLKEERKSNKRKSKGNDSNVKKNKKLKN